MHLVILAFFDSDVIALSLRFTAGTSEEEERMLASEPEQRKRAVDATASEILGEPSPLDPSRISLSSSSFGCSSLSLGSYSIHESDIARSSSGSFSEIDALYL
jgi:hypothetical protein